MNLFRENFHTSQSEAGSVHCVNVRNAKNKTKMLEQTNALPL